jgi:putative ABC transport system permease protein
VRPPFWLKLAWRESRASARRLGVYMGAITIGVAALVAINSFRAQVIESVDAESKALLGADLRLHSNRAFPDTVEAILDSISATGVPVSRVVTTLSVAMSEMGVPQLVQVRAVEGGYPYYGEMVTQPAGMWEQLQAHDAARPAGTASAAASAASAASAAPDALRADTAARAAYPALPAADPSPAAGRMALLEASLLDALGVVVGDSVRLANAWFHIGGVLTALPPDISFRSALGPRVYINAADLEATGLLQFGSLARHEAYLLLPQQAAQQRFVEGNRRTLREAAVGIDTAAEQAENLGRALEALGRFLGLVGLSALLLGGLGVASAVHVFVKDKRRTVAVLRCLGATQRTAFGAYMVQAMVLGLAGATLGALLGVGIQALLPGVVGDLLPIDVPFAVQWPVIGIGIAIGALVAATFALLPLLAIRGISPLQALRHDVDEGPRRFDPWRWSAFILILASIVAIAIWQARYWQAGLAYAGALLVGTGVLWAASLLLIHATRRLARRGFAIARSGRGGSGRRRVFTARQGIANLFRPRNQTTAVIMSLGFGVFLVATLWVVQANLLGWIRSDVAGPQPNLVLFDIQRDQVDDVRATLQPFADAVPDLVPIVTARIARINDEDTRALLDRDRTPRIEPWAVRREYRNTYRDSLTSAERLVEGPWFDDAPAAEPGVVRVSAEQDVARSLGVGIGDRITWDVAGIPVESVITSIRTVDWARFETNFFFVFETGALEDAPQTIVSLVSIVDDTARAAAQRAIAERFTNVSIVDLATVQRLLRRIVDRVIYAIRFMAAFSLAAGALVLFGAIAASRFQRVRESALLRALGATRTQVRNILLVEYAALGALAAFTGVVLAAIAGWLAMRFVFKMPFDLPVLSLLAIWAGVSIAAAVLGMLNSREALRSTPLAALREAES